MSRPLRVLLVGPSLRILGGQSIQAARLLEKFRHEPDIDATFLPVDPVLPGPLALLQRVRYLRTLVTSARYLVSLVATCPRHDVLHVFSASYVSFLLAPSPAVFLARAFGRGVVINYRSGEADDHLARWPRSTRAVLSRVDRIVVPSGYLVDVFGRYGYAAEAIHNFVDAGCSGRRPRERPRPLFLANRNLEPLYRTEDVIEAFRLIRDEMPDARLTIAGEGSERFRLERLAEGLGGITFVGRVDQDRMWELYDAHDIYLNASAIDNMPGSIIEAFAAGLPVVSTDAGGIPYIVETGRNGVLVPVGDASGLARESLRLVREPDRAARMARAALDDCTAYSWPAVRDQWLRVYRRAARAGGARPDGKPR